MATKLKTYGKDFYSKAGKKGGQARNKSDKRYTPFSDREFASKMGKKAAKARWAKLDLEDFDL